MCYLSIYGILQCLYVQQDAVESLVRAFEPNTKPMYRIESEPGVAEVRMIRSKATGHPTKEGDVNSKNKPGVQMSHCIVQHSLNKNGFTLMTSFSDRSHTFTDVSIPELVQKNRAAVERVLTRIMKKLEAAEMEHRKTFRDERLADLFPETLDYCFEKVFAGTANPTSSDGRWGGIHLEMIADKVRLFRGALRARGALNSYWECDISEVEYPLSELQRYWEGNGTLKDPRAAAIFAYFLREKVFKLRDAVVELDEEYQEDLGGLGPTDIA